MSEQRRVALIVRERCHLCETARKVLRSVCEPLGVEWDELDVDANPERQRTYGELVPVVLVDGVQVGYWRIDPERLRIALVGDTTRRRGLFGRRREPGHSGD